VVVVVQGQDSENIVILMAGLAIVAALLLVPVIAIWVAVSSLLSGRVDVAAILPLSVLRPLFLPCDPGAYLVRVSELNRALLGVSEGGSDLCELGSWSGYGGDDGSSQRASRYNAPGKHTGVQ
jgi:hypothetical protein